MSNKLIDLKRQEDDIINELYENPEATQENLDKLDNLQDIKNKIKEKTDAYISVLKYRLPKEKEILEEKKKDLDSVIKRIKSNEEHLKSLLFQCAEEPLEGSDFIIKQSPTTRKTINRELLQPEDILMKHMFKLPRNDYDKYVSAYYGENATDKEFANLCMEFFDRFWEFAAENSEEELPLVSSLKDNHPALVKTLYPNIRIIKK